MRLYVFSLPIHPCDWENIYTLSYYHHQIGRMIYYPLFRDRSCNNGVRCMSFYILIMKYKETALWHPHMHHTHTHTHTCNLLKPSRKWRCSWSSADRRCANYIWVINNFITYQGVSHVRDLTVRANLVNRVSWSRTSSYRQMFSWLRCITIFQ